MSGTFAQKGNYPKKLYLTQGIVVVWGGMGLIGFSSFTLTLLEDFHSTVTPDDFG